MEQTRRSRLVNMHVPPHVKVRLQSSWVTIPNILTFSRLLLAPFIVAGLVAGWWRMVFVLFITAGITDMLDGYLARRLQAQSIVGAYLDPIADKVLFVSCFITLALIQFPSVAIPRWFLILVLVREAVILTGAIIVVWLRPRATVAPTKSGKLTTTGYAVVVGWMFVCYFASWMPRKSFTAVLIVVAGLAIISLLQYLWRGVRWLLS